MAIQNPQELQFEQLLEDHKYRNALLIEQFKDAGQRNLEQYKTTEAIHLVSFKASLDFGAYASRGMLLLPGGAAIALLAFLGSGRATDWQATMLAPCLATFAVAAFFAVGNMGFTYLAQSVFTYATRKRWEHSPTGYTLQGVAVVLWLIAAWLFVEGLWRTARVFSPEFTLSSVFSM
jgi:hypothetical protein